MVWLSRSRRAMGQAMTGDPERPTGPDRRAVARGLNGPISVPSDVPAMLSDGASVTTGWTSPDPPSRSTSGVDGRPEAGEAIPVERVPDPLSPSIPLYEARLAQDLQVMGDGRLALAQRTDEVAYADLALG